MVMSERDLSDVPWRDYTPAERLALQRRQAEHRKAGPDWWNVPWSELPPDVAVAFEQVIHESVDSGIEIPPRDDRDRIGREHGLAPSIARRLAGSTDAEIEAAAVEQLAEIERTKKRLQPKDGEQ